MIGPMSDPMADLMKSSPTPWPSPFPKPQPWTTPWMNLWLRLSPCLRNIVISGTFRSFVLLWCFLDLVYVDLRPGKQEFRCQHLLEPFLQCHVRAPAWFLLFVVFVDDNTDDDDDAITATTQGSFSVIQIFTRSPNSSKQTLERFGIHLIHYFWVEKLYFWSQCPHCLPVSIGV